MLSNEWIVTKYCSENIRKLGFIFDQSMKCWQYTFPLKKWHKVPTLLCRIYVSEEKDHATLHVMDSYENIYPAYYDEEFGNYEPLLKNIDKKILYKLKSLGIIEKKEKNKEKKKIGRLDRKSTNQVPRRRTRSSKTGSRK